MSEQLIQTFTIGLSQRAATKIQSIMAEQNMAGSGLRVFVSGGGCSGLQFGMAIEPEVRPTDRIVESTGIRVIIDPESAEYLDGAQIDFEDDPQRPGFRIENVAQPSCGCGRDGCGDSGCGH